MQRTTTAALIVVLIAIATSSTAPAANSYTGANPGVWENDGNWNGAHYPGSPSSTDNDTRISDNDIVNLGVAVDLDQLGTTEQLLLSGTGILNVQDGATLDVGASTFSIAGTAILNQSNGTVTAGTATIGANASNSRYNLVGGTATFDNLRISRDNSSASIMAISDGTLNVSTKLYVAGGTNSKGTNTLEGGTVNLTGTASMDVVAVGTGRSLFHQSGGVFNNAAGQIVKLDGGTVAGREAEFRFSGGTFNANGGKIQNSTDGLFAMSGGTLNMGGGNLQTYNGNFANGGVAAYVDIVGGMITGVSNLYGEVRLDGATAVFIAGWNTNGASTTIVPTWYGGYQMVTGTTVFPVYGDNSASKLDHKTGYNQGLFSLTGGVVSVSIADGYTPAAGHSYDLVDGNQAGNLSTANITNITYDGGWDITWDTSDWLANGVLTVQSATYLLAPKGTVVAVQ